MNKKIIEQAAYRFSGWKLPEDFAPDAGINFVRNKFHDRHGMPTGTNLFHHGQVMAMFEYCLAESKDNADDVDEKCITDVGSERYDFYKDGQQFCVLIRPDNKIALVANVDGTSYMFNTSRVVDTERYPIAWVVNTKYGVGISYAEKFWELHPNFYDGKPEPLPKDDVEPVMWQYRYRESAYVYSRNSSKWSNWEIVEARIGSTVQARLDEIKFYNDNDMGQYEIRALYVK